MPTLVWQILPPLLMLALLAVPMAPFVFVFWVGGFVRRRVLRDETVADGDRGRAQALGRRGRERSALA